MESRQDAAETLLKMVRPLKPFYSPGGARLSIGAFSAHYGRNSAEMEGFSRLLWGLAPFWRHSEDKEFLPIFQSGLISGTSPQSSEYWGKVFDYDQKIVEMAAIAAAIGMAPEKLWDVYSSSEKAAIHTWMAQINDCGTPRNNWLFFRVLANLMFRKLGLPADTERLRSDLDSIESFYSGDGWYFDGERSQIDYYVPFALHYYGLMCSFLFGDDIFVKNAAYKERADLFAQDFLHWFTKDGAAIPFGRSLTYRFAQGSFFSALALAGSRSLPVGALKAAALRNIDWWLKRPIFDNAGILTVGYAYPNLFMSERYNAPGSPYWAFKAFACLALHDCHPFWASSFEEFKPETKKALPHARMIVVRDSDNEHAVMYPAGQKAPQMGSILEKYEKFAYSSVFGFSVSRGRSLAEGAFDSSLAASAKGSGMFLCRDGVLAFKVADSYVWSKYVLGNLANVETWIIPSYPWHIRIHAIEALDDIDIADCGFAIAAEQEGVKPPVGAAISDRSIMASFPWGTSGMALERLDFAQGHFELVNAFPNTNLISPLTVIPAFLAELGKGPHLLITSVAGSKTAESVDKRPAVKCANGIVEAAGARIDLTSWAILGPTFPLGISCTQSGSSPSAS
jgi:hypothetical protein